MSDEMDRMNEEESDLIELIDEETGDSVNYEHLATVEYEGDSYLVLADPEVAAEEEDDLEVFIMKIEQDEDGNDIYVVPDNDTADAVFETFTDMLDDMDDGEE